jgi:hypothetical protein
VHARLHAADDQTERRTAAAYGVGIGLSAYGFPQSSEEIPFNEVPFVVTTWGKWRAKNPQSIVYLGSPEVAKSFKQKAA